MCERERERESPMEPSPRIAPGIFSHFNTEYANAKGVGVTSKPSTAQPKRTSSLIGGRTIRSCLQLG